MPFAKRFSITK